MESKVGKSTRIAILQDESGDSIGLRLCADKPSRPQSK